MSESSASNPSGVTTLSLKPGDKVDSFTVVDTIATTGSAVVYKAHDELLDRHVAIKQIILGDGDTEAALRKRIREEAAIHKRLSTAQPKHLIQFIDAVDDERGLMLVSEYYLSTSLEDLLNQKSGPMDERQALGIVAATAKGLDAIHQAGVVHRDLKPSNILLGEDGGLKICDFGLSALIEAQESLSLGSVRYMAPELLKSEPADGRADLYSLGIIAYEMLAGRDNFDTAFRNVLRDQRNQAMRWMKWHTNARVAAPPLDEYLSDLPLHLTQLVARMMDKDQTRRVGSAEDVLEAIRRHFTGDGPEERSTTGRSRDLPATATSSPGDTAPLPERSKLPIILAGLLGFWILVGATLYIVNENKKAAALNRAIAEAEALIQRGIDLYDEGKYEDALENYRLVVADRPADSLQAKQAQLGIWKTEGRRAFNAGLYTESIDFFEQYVEHGGQDQSVANVIEEAEDARAFALLTADIEQKVDALAFRDATQVLRDARETELTDAQSSALDDLETLIGQRRAEALADERIAEARTLLAQGDLPTAIAALEDLASLPPEGQDLLDKLKSDLAYNQAMETGEESLRRGGLGQAIDAFTAALALRPDARLADRVQKLDARRLTEEGALLFERGQYEEAGRRFADALEKDPANTDALRLSRQITAATELSTIERAGDAAAARGNFAAAVTQFEKALEITPENATIQSKLNNVRVSYNTQQARQSMQREDFEAARELLDVATLLAPEDNAVKALLTELDLQERYHTLLGEGEEALSSKDYRTAKRKFVDARKLVPGDEVEQRIEETDFQQYLARAREYLGDGEYDAARAMLDQARKLRPANPVLIQLLNEVEKADDAASDGRE